MTQAEAEQQYRKLKKDVEAAKEEASRAEGALGQLMTQLEEKFECGNLKEAEALLTKLQRRKDKAGEELQEAIKEYEKEWKNG